jgi:hypothetical protein
MIRIVEKSLLLATLAAAVSASLAACTTSEGGHHVTGTAGTGVSGTAGSGAPGTAGTGNPAGTAGNGVSGTAGDSSATGTAGASGSSGGGTAGATGGGSGTAGATGGAGASGTAGAAGTGSGTDGGAGASGTAGISGGDGGAGKIPTCISNDVAGAVNRVNTNFSECDVQDQAIDFDVAAGYAAALYNNKTIAPGYDPSTTPVTISNYGTVFSGYQVQSCHPYCYQQNLTIGVDFVPGSDTSLRGEIFFDFPKTGKGLPITNAAGRASLGWIYLDGPALPAGAMVTAQMELKSTDNGLLTAMEIKKVPLKTWVEFRYFPIDSTFDKTKLTNITTIGFKLTMATAGAAEWHGVIYADHFQLRM